MATWQAFESLTSLRVDVEELPRGGVVEGVGDLGVDAGVPGEDGQ